MKNILLILSSILFPAALSAHVVKDTLFTGQNDRVILCYEVITSGDNVTFKVAAKPRIIPSDNLRKSCKGDLESLKLVLFDRVGDSGNVKWDGILPSAFMVPSGLSYSKSVDGFYFLDGAVTLSFIKNDTGVLELYFPLYLAVIERKHKYRLVEAISEPLKVSIGRNASVAVRDVETEEKNKMVTDREHAVAADDNDDVAKALCSIQMIRQMLPDETELPFSNTLQMEIFNLRTLKNSLKDRDVIKKINELLLECNDKERELKDLQREASLAAQAQEKALLEMQKSEEAQRQKEAEENLRIQEEKQQKRNFLMIIGGIILAALTFIGNAVSKHFRDLKNQKSIMQMQESLARQAKHEASRRSREIVRNKAHEAANKGKSRIRESVKDTGKTKTNTKRRSI